jgi:hypothetical protein
MTFSNPGPMPTVEGRQPTRVTPFRGRLLGRADSIESAVLA